MVSGYSVPIRVFDHTPVEVDREQGIYLGHTTTAMNSKGEILAVYPKWHGCGQVVLKKSADGGKTWSDRLPVPESWTKSYNTPNLYNLKDAAGKERLMLFSTDHYPPFRSYSEDGGDTWTEFSTEGMPHTGAYGFMGVTEVGPGHYLAFFQENGAGQPCTYDAAAEQYLIFAAGEGTDRRTSPYQLERDENGQWYDTHCWMNLTRPLLREGEKWTFVDQQFKHAKFEDKHHEIHQVESTDGGMTWSEPRMIASTPADCFICEPEVIKSPDGKELTMIMRENLRNYNSMIMRSRDGGKTWTEPEELPHGALTGHRHTAKYLKDGRLVIAFRDVNPYSPTDGNFAGWIGTYDDLVSGREGETRLLFGKTTARNDCGYPGVEVLADGTAVVTTYGRWTQGELPYIRCFRFHPDELDKLAVLR